jgi:argininosuccinate synthase
MVENRLVGIKSRGVYQTPGGTLLIEAHKALEAICLERDTMHYKQILELKNAEMIYNGQYFHPLRAALQKFFDETQLIVTGSVNMKMYKGGCIAATRKSAESLYDVNLSTFEEGADYDQKDAKGFIKIFGLPMEVYARKHKWIK